MALFSPPPSRRSLLLSNTSGPQDRKDKVDVVWITIQSLLSKDRLIGSRGKSGEIKVGETLYYAKLYFLFNARFNVLVYVEYVTLFSKKNYIFNIRFFSARGA